MTRHDPLGLALSGATDEALDHFQLGVHQLQCFVGDPVGAADRAIVVAPDFVMAHVLKGYLFGLSTEREAMPVALACHAAAAALPATPRERAHVAALGHLAAGRWHAAGRLLAGLTEETPHDALALQAGHQIDFFTGDASMLATRIARALPAWDESMPGHHALLGMHAFGLEESGDYAKAERAGRRAIDLQPRDGWAQHAVAHVMEMQARQRDGIAWMRGNEPAWTGDSFLQIHNWWHLALFHHDLGEIDAVLDLYDRPIAGGGSTYVLNLDDASAILWRLYLGGVDVGSRWQALAKLWAPKARDGTYAFNDMHAMMAFAAAGMDDAADELVAAQMEAMRRDDDNAAFTRDVGRSAAFGMRAFAQGRHAEAVRLLAPLPPVAHRFGGSHAQRDVIDLTLIEAAIRAGDGATARTLTARRLAARPASPLAAMLARRASALALC